MMSNQKKVLALYRQAAGTDNPHERDAFLAKARELDVEPLETSPNVFDFFFGLRDGETDRRSARRSSWQRYYHKVARTPEYRAKRREYMRRYRAASTAAPVPR